MKWVMEKKITAAYVIVLFIFIVFGLVEYRSFGKLDDAANWRKHTYEVIGQLHQVLSTLQKFLYEVGHGRLNIPSLRSLLEDILPRNSHLDDFEVIQQLLF